MSEAKCPTIVLSSRSKSIHLRSRAVTQFMVDQVDPQLGEIVLDPACGTGGFLACATEHIHSKTEKEKPLK
ncbi:MAG: hypothetical protein CBB75_04115 [bacterium TMED15]|nr:MAG: hypothetical protein CBB75_04115 [bacterium TMED15]